LLEWKALSRTLERLVHDKPDGLTEHLNSIEKLANHLRTEGARKMQRCDKLRDNRRHTIEEFKFFTAGYRACAARVEKKVAEQTKKPRR
jgi:hypothetical protein